MLILLNLPLFPSCGKKTVLEKVKESGEISVLTRNNAHCCYTYRDNPMGFEYDLAKAFSEYLRVKKVEIHEDTLTEELIRMVPEKEIEVTIAASNIALLNRRYYPDVRITFPIEEPESLGWAVRKGETTLQNEINKFFKKIKKARSPTIYHTAIITQIALPFDFISTPLLTRVGCISRSWLLVSLSLL